jgi:hypothetical protein
MVHRGSILEEITTHRSMRSISSINTLESEEEQVQRTMMTTADLMNDMKEDSPFFRWRPPLPMPLFHPPGKFPNFL